MKNVHFIVSVLLISIMFSCSSDDSSSENSSNFLTPLTVWSYWTYDVEVQSGSSRDSLFIDSETTVNSNTYNVFKTRDDIATGFYSSALRNNKVRESNGKLLLTGDLAISAGVTLPIDLDLTLNDFIIFNKNASNNQVLNSSPKTGTINETVNGYPLSINYSLQSYRGETLSSFTTNGITYTNLNQLKLN